MAESQYAKYILKSPTGKLHDGRTFDGFLASPEQLWKIGKPVNWVEVMLTSHYERK